MIRASFQSTQWNALLLFILLLASFGCCFQSNRLCAQFDFSSVSQQVQPKMVKINGSGGFRGLESYQSGILISADGYVLTVWSYVLDGDVTIATLNDGQKFEAKVVGYDPRIGIAVLKIEIGGQPAFNLDAATSVEVGDRVLTFSNLYEVAAGNEPHSLLQGVVSAKTNLSARSGATQSSYQGTVYVLDAMTNNPGAAGGAVTDSRGRLVGLIGKELKDRQTNSWLNFAIPISELAGSVHDIRSGKMVVDSTSARQLPSEPMTATLLGFSLVPNVVSKTPPFIEAVVAESEFGRAGVRPDDLIVAVAGRMTPSRQDVERMLTRIDRDATVSFTVQRNQEFLTFDVQLNR